MLSSEKGKLAGKSGQWTLASSGSLVHLCNEPLHKRFICCFSTWMCLCQINEFPLPFRGKAPDMLKTQCSSQKISFPSNCPLSLYLLCQTYKENMKNCLSKCYCISLSEKFQCPFSFCPCMFNKPKSAESKCSSRCCSNFSTIHHSSTDSTGSPIFLLCLNLSPQRFHSSLIPWLVTKPTEKWNRKELASLEQ